MKNNYEIENNISKTTDFVKAQEDEIKIVMLLMESELLIWRHSLEGRYDLIKIACLITG